eukprot:gene27625-30125_t
MAVTDDSGSPIGTVSDTFKCCAVHQRILDADGALRYTLGPTSRLQKGFFCPCCADIVFPVYAAD